MKGSLSFVFLLCGLGIFAWWQVSANAEKSAAIKAQAEKITALEQRAERVDEAIDQWRQERERIAGERQKKREKTRVTAGREPSFKEFLETPLHPALLPVPLGGSGLLGEPDSARPDSGGIPAADSAP